MSNILSTIMTVLVTLMLSFCFIIEEEGKKNFLYVFSKLVKQFTIVLSFATLRKLVSVICNTSQ